MISDTPKTSMHPLERKDIFCCLAVFMLVFLYNLPFLGYVLPFVPDEVRYGDVAREMLSSGDWVVPTMNGVPFLDKPPLYYWLVALSLKLFGVSGYGLRLPIALFASLGAGVTYLFATLFYGRTIARLSAVILASSPLYFISAHYSNMDLIMAVLLWAAMTCFMVGLLRAPVTFTNRAVVWAGYIFTALAFLTKGLMAFAFPVCTFIIWRIWVAVSEQPPQRQSTWRYIVQLDILVGVVIMAAIILPWIILAQMRVPSFFFYFFYEQQIYRYVSDQFNQQQGTWFYPALAFVGTFPWSLAVPVALLTPGKKLGWLRSALAYEPTLLVVIWTVFVLIFFSIPASKPASYALCFLPSLSILLALVCWNLAQSRHFSLMRYALYALSAGTAVVLTGYGVALWVLAASVFWAIPLFAILFLSLLFFFVFLWRQFYRVPDLILPGLTVYLVLFGLLNPFIYASIRSIQTSKVQLCPQSLRFLNKPGDDLSLPLLYASTAQPSQSLPVCAQLREQFQTQRLDLFMARYGFKPVLFSAYLYELPFYLRQSVYLVGEWEVGPVRGDGSMNLIRYGIQQYRERWGQMPSHFLSYEQFGDMWRKKVPMLIFVEHAHLQKLQELTQTQHVCTLTEGEEHDIIASL